ncbi:M61 family metallopeptidase [Mycoavidus sp. SF9855]|uniref:M61 family metallopeptidase n=1 Tax=Mycoavidus sp. SF9855 TaxID=2968475 RepID=UPI00211C0567|nr:PDZ domain-containing protein [Mycoavidus sp. SF9855]UUM21818.1 PDZ domain-containing protein [Mycoavidus sp. SF9855]
MKPIHYTIIPKHPAAHLFEVTLTVLDPDPVGQRFMLPVWIPGSYKVREFARHIVTIKAHSVATGRQVPLQKIDKHNWQAAPVKGALILTYEVYAWELSVRAAHLDDTIGFFNGTSVFLAVLGQQAAPCCVEIKAPLGTAYHDWRVATTLAEAEATHRHGFGEYRAANYDELIDHPVMLGEFALACFNAYQVAHEVVIGGKVSALDLARLTQDLQRICETQIAFFEPQTKGAPFKRYMFMTMALTDGFGGLEHRASSALICKRSDLPAIGCAPDKITDGYRDYLSLCSHEYFHSWNVKRIKPTTFAPYDLAHENYTTLLWLFEGFTSYYDDLMLVRSGLMSMPDYFALLGKTLAKVLRGSGRFKQSVAESSFDAWTKYYMQDENAANAIVSYYQKGALIALAFDLAIRAQTKSTRSLDDVMRLLWQRYGRDFYQHQPVGITDDEIEALLHEATGVDLSELYQEAVYGTNDLPLTELLAPFEVTLEAEVANHLPSLGMRVREGVWVEVVYEGGAAQRAGLSAGDRLVALDGLRVHGSNLDALLARYQTADQFDVHIFRRDELRCVQLTLDPPEVASYRLHPSESRSEACKWRAAWLSG